MLIQVHLFSVMVKNITVSNNCKDEKSVTVSWTINQTFPIGVKNSIYIRRDQYDKPLNLSKVWLNISQSHHEDIIFRLHMLKLIKRQSCYLIETSRLICKAGLQGKGEGISLTPHYHFHAIHRHLDISWAVTAESSPLHIASSRTRTGNLWFPSASR